MRWERLNDTSRKFWAAELQELIKMTDILGCYCMKWGEVSVVMQWGWSWAGERSFRSCLSSQAGPWVLPGSSLCDVYKECAQPPGHFSLKDALTAEPPTCASSKICPGNLLCPLGPWLLFMSYECSFALVHGSKALMWWTTPSFQRAWLGRFGLKLGEEEELWRSCAASHATAPAESQRMDIDAISPPCSYALK